MESMTNEGVAVLQASMDRIMANLARWNQNAWCDLNGEAEPITEKHAKAGRYHDFELPAELIAEINRTGVCDSGWVPVANCGTSFCLAGDIAVNNGYTFVTQVWADGANDVIRTVDLPNFLRGSDDVMERSASVVALELLGVPYDSSVRQMFSADNSLLDLWAYGYGFSEGRLRLPESIPEGYDDALTGKDKIERAIHTRMYHQRHNVGMSFPNDTVIDMDLVDRAEINY